jgi:hypothetical protein
MIKVSMFVLGQWTDIEMMKIHGQYLKMW